MALAVIAVFAAVMWGLSRWLRRREQAGDFDFRSSGPPGVRWFFDWRGSGTRQRPTDGGN